MYTWIMEAKIRRKVNIIIKKEEKKKAVQIKKIFPAEILLVMKKIEYFYQKNEELTMMKIL